MTKDEARAMGGKSDHVDLCDALHWYGDGICDDFCPRWDEDCGPEPTAGCGGIAGLTCPEGQFCEYAEGDMCGAADQLGTCQVPPEICTREFRPVCGCDGRTYGNACGARAAGTSVASEGECEPQCTTDEECPQPLCLPGGPCPRFVCDEGQCVRAPASCGGIGGAPCVAGQYCHYEPSAMCGAADELGTCQDRPQICNELYSPVCGCDGETYGNACFANAAGTSVAASGECDAPAADCRPTGCGVGEYCTYCWTGYACIPEGAVC